MDFKDLTRKERSEALAALGEKPFREKQIFKWICAGAESFAEMTDLPAALREKLAERCSFKRGKIELCQTSRDGTSKFLISFPDGEKAETVFMSYEYGNSLCVSTQVGCNMGCVFCASGIGGKVRDLKAWEMLEQYLLCAAHTGKLINHIVLMGMGEPMDNYEQVSEFLRQIHDPAGVGLSYRNITVSSCGLIPKLEQFEKDFPQVNLAISLHASDQETREKLMPAAKTYKLDELIPFCRKHAEVTGRRVTFEYALIAGRNDTDADAKKLAALLRGLNCHVNLIPLNTVTESGLKSSGRPRALDFQKKLLDQGIQCTVRRQLGADIDAACGQLRKNHPNRPC